MSDGLRREIRPITSLGEWLAWRQDLVTASPIGALFGCHPYVTLEDLAAEKRGLKRGEGDNASMRRGRIFETAVIAAIQEEHPEWSVEKATTFHVLPDLRLGCTPDAFGDDDLLIQIKTVAPRTWEEWRGHPPLHYTLQTLCELLVTGRARGVLAVMVMSASYPVHYFDVPRHAGAEQRILDAVSAWWAEHDAGRIAPAISSAEIAAETDDGSHIDLSADNLLPSLLEDRAALKATVGECDKRLKAIDDTIRERVGAARSAWLPGWLIRLPTIEAKAYSVPARSYRRLDVRPTKEDEAA